MIRDKWTIDYEDDFKEQISQVLRHGATSRFYAQLINNLNLILWQARFITKI